MNDAEAEIMLSLALFYIHGCKSASSYSNHNAQDGTVHRKVVCLFVEVLDLSELIHDRVMHILRAGKALNYFCPILMPLRKKLRSQVTVLKQ